jgi:hypothetical protein
MYSYYGCDTMQSRNLISMLPCNFLCPDITTVLGSNIPLSPLLSNVLNLLFLRNRRCSVSGQEYIETYKFFKPVLKNGD